MSGVLFQNGQRKYLTRQEREAFLKAAEKSEREVRTFCGVLAFTGCRISEALALTPERIDLNAGVIVFESLKKRKKGVYRAVPAPPELLDALDLVHGIREAQKTKAKTTPLWAWSRTTAWRRVKAVMTAAGITAEIAASPKGLRHGLGVTAVTSGIPLNLVKNWLGHANLSTTAIYAEAVGDEEKQIAAKMW